MATVLARRGFTDVASARRFLEASEAHGPFQMGGMERAVDLVLEHLRSGAVIAVHGDYDVDGVCATALVTRVLRRLGGTVRCRLPSRMEDGYGLSVEAVKQLHAQGARLLVTVDCGIGAIEEVALARRLGMDVLVTDHHRAGEELPDCPLVHPAVGGYPCADLCATGVAYKLCEALYEALGHDTSALEDELDLVALATVADVVPLLGENRTLVRQGLRALAGTQRVGLRALMRVAGVEPQAVGERAVAFALAPRINAAGRLYRADAALELLLTEDPARAQQVARELDAVNSERQALETRILFEAEGRLGDAEGQEADPLYVLAGEGWHPGVIGIVASRLVERHHRPCVLVALDPSGCGRGSGRSVSAYDLHAGLAASKAHLVRFGGHRMAAGLELQAQSLERFRASMVEHARSVLRPEDLLPVEPVDAIVPGDAISLSLAEELEQLRPFGMGNPGVNLLIPAARVSDVRAMGEGRHARFTLTSAGVRTRAVVFGVSAPLGADQPAGARHDLVGRLEVNEWRGAVEPRLVLRSLHPLSQVEARNPESEPGCAACACRAEGAEWWDRVWQELESSVADIRARDGRRHSTPVTVSERASWRTVIDRRGHGIFGSLSDLLSTGEPLLVACADVSRRRRLLECELAPARFDRPPAVIVSSRCTTAAVESAECPSERDFCLIDYETLAHSPDIAWRFAHIFALDPPPFEPVIDLLARAPHSDQPSFLHLGWGASELEFARKALEHEYGLGAALRAIYLGLVPYPDGIEGPMLEAVLTGDGWHPRAPAVAGRCLRVLRELGLARIVRSSATVSCTIISSGRVELERSEAFRVYTSLYREGLRFLDEPAQPKRTASAA